MKDYYIQTNTLDKYILSDNGINKAINDGSIKINTEILDEQIQPSTLDIRIGKVKVYDNDAYEKTKEAFYEDICNAFLDNEPTCEFAKIYPDEKDIPIILPPNSFSEIYFHENITIDFNKYYARLDLRSSRGRLCLALFNESINTDMKGKNYIAITNNNPNPIILYGQSKFAQLFFFAQNKETYHDGYVVNDPVEAKNIAQNICIDDYEMYGHYIIFKIGEKILKYKEFGTYDTNQKYEEESIFHIHNTKSPFLVNQFDALITQLTPKIHLPNDVGIKILPSIPLVQKSNYGEICSELGLIENHTAYAGWADPGYKGNLTAHPLRTKNKTIFEKNQKIGLGIIYKYNNPVKRPYGSKALNSHYQGSNGSASKS